MIHFTPLGTPLEPMIERWSPLAPSLEFRPLRDGVKDDLVRFIREIRAASGPDDIINVIIPETVRRPGLRHLAHSLRVQRLKAALVAESGTVVTNIVVHAGDGSLESSSKPTDDTSVGDGWRHVALVLVSGVHNASTRSLRYARSLRADELHCVHVAVDEQEAAKIADEWDARDLSPTLEILPSPYRQIAEPIRARVHDILDRMPSTFVTIVIPEFVVRKRWHHLMHNKTALALKATFLFEPNMVVSSVPYRL